MEAACHRKDQDAIAHGVAGSPRDAKSTILETGAAIVQSFTPLKSICAHLNAFHVYADPITTTASPSAPLEPLRQRPPIETHHYCAHLTQNLRQCLLYDSSGPGARLIGIEYMITPEIYTTLDDAERKLWHSHVFEVKSGMLVMPQGVLPNTAWEVAETKEMEEVVKLYGKAYHLWQVDRGDAVPLGPPVLMTSITEMEGQVEGLEEKMDERDERLRESGMGVDWRRKREIRKGIEEPEIHPDADSAWKKQ